MKQRVLILFALASMLATSHAQEVTVEAQIDSVVIFIGEQVGVTFTVMAPESLAVQMPLLTPRQELTAGVEVVDVLPADTTHADGSKTITRKILLTSFDENAYKLPAQTITVGGKEYHTNPLALKVLTLEVDTLNPDQFFPPKDVQDNPFLWSDWSGAFWMSCLLFVLIIIGIYLYIRYKQNKPIISRILIIRHIPPHQKALTAIEQIKQEKMHNAADQKAYYTKLTETLRLYIEERFGFSAMEMTSSEIIAHLQQAGDATMISELRDLFEVADLVKFAKHAALINENDLNLVNAINFIDQTKTQEKEHEERIVPQLSKNDKRLQESRQIIRLLLAVLAVAGAAILCYVVYKVMILF